MGKSAPKKKGKKSAAKAANAKAKTTAMKKAGVGIFAPKTLSKELAAICGKPKMARAEVTKAIWVYIKKHPGCQNGRIVKPDATLAKVLGSAPIDMLKMAGKISPHLK